MPSAIQFSKETLFGLQFWKILVCALLTGETFDIF